VSSCTTVEAISWPTATSRSN
jgi:hypothetical protein